MESRRRPGAIILQDDGQLERLEARRKKKSYKGRMTFRCFNAFYNHKTDAVECKLGKALAADRRFTIHQTLSGMCAKVCWECRSYDDKDLPASEAFMEALLKDWVPAERPRRRVNHDKA